MAPWEVTNMVMAEDPATGKLLVIRRRKSWCGIAFPGGHVEKGESVYQSAVRELYEETGLLANHLTPCGFMDWCHDPSGDRYLCFYYRTDDFSGTLLDSTEEGEIFWINREDLLGLPDEELAPNFRDYLHFFLDGDLQEGFCYWKEDAEEIITLIHR